MSDDELRPGGRRVTDSKLVDRRHPVRSYLLGSPYQFGIAAAAVLAALTYLFSPDSIQATAVAYRLAWMLPIWEALYGLGGFAVVCGMLLCQTRLGWRLELAGLSLLSSAVIVNGVAVSTVKFPLGVTSAATFLALAVAGVARGWMLVKSMGLSRR